MLFRSLTGRKLAALALFLPALTLVHYFTAGVFVAGALFAVTRAGKGARIRTAGVLLVCMAVTAMAWGPFFIRQMSSAVSTGDSWLRTVEPMPWRVFKYSALVPLRLVVERNYGNPLFTVAGVLLICVLCITAFRYRPLRPFVLWICASAGLVAAMDLVRQTRHIMHIRYLTPAMPGLFPAMIAWPSGLSSRVPPFIRRGGVHLMGATLFLFALFSWKDVVRYDSPQTLAIAEIAAGCAGPDDAVIIRTGGGVEGYDRSILLSLSHLPGFFPRDAVLLTRPMGKKALRKLSGRHAVLICAGTDGDVWENVPGAVQAGQARAVKGKLWCCRIWIGISP